MLYSFYSFSVTFVHVFVFKSLKTHSLKIYRFYLLSFVETPRKFIIAELSIRKLGSSSVLIILYV